MKLNLKISIYFFTLFSFAYAEKLRLKRADILESKRIRLEKVKLLQGNIEFQKGELELNAKIVFTKKKDIAHLYSNVIVNKKDLTLSCDSITFFSKKINLRA